MSQIRHADESASLSNATQDGGQKLWHGCHRFFESQKDSDTSVAGRDWVASRLRVTSFWVEENHVRSVREKLGRRESEPAGMPLGVTASRRRALRPHFVGLIVSLFDLQIPPHVAYTRRRATAGD